MMPLTADPVLLLVAGLVIDALFGDMPAIFRYVPHPVVLAGRAIAAKFARRYANVGEMISRTVREYCDDVRAGMFPSDAESYHAARAAKEEKEAPVNTDGDW